MQLVGKLQNNDTWPMATRWHITPRRTHRDCPPPGKDGNNRTMGQVSQALKCNRTQARNVCFGGSPARPRPNRQHTAQPETTFERTQTPLGPRHELEPWRKIYGANYVCHTETRGGNIGAKLTTHSTRHQRRTQMATGAACTREQDSTSERGAKTQPAACRKREPWLKLPQRDSRSPTCGYHTTSEAEHCKVTMSRAILTVM